MKKITQEKTIKLKEKVVFDFALEQSANNVAISLCRAGFYVNIRRINEFYVVYVYQVN